MAEPIYISRAPAVPAEVSVASSAVRAPNLQIGLGAAVAQLGEAGEHAAAAIGSAQNLARELDAKATYVKKVGALRDQYLNDPDPQTAPVRFEHDKTKLESDILAQARLDPLNEARLKFYFAHVGAPIQGRLDKASLTREQKVSVDNLDTITAAHADNAINAGSAIERQAAFDAHAEDVRGAARAGWISPADASDRVMKFAQTVDGGDAETLIRHDPELASVLLDDPENFRALTSSQRAIWQRTAAGAAARLERAGNAVNTEQDGLSLARTGKLDAAWLQTNAGVLSPRQVARLSGLTVAHAPVDSDPQQLGELLARATDDRRAISDAADAFAAGRLSRADFNLVHDTARRFDRDVEERPWAIDARKDILDAVQPVPGQDPAAARQQLGALKAFDAWLDATPDANADQANEQAQALIGRYRARGAAAERAVLPLPRFAPVAGKDFDGDALAAAAQKLKNARARGEISGDATADEVELMQRWQDVMQREGGGAGARRGTMTKPPRDFSRDPWNKPTGPADGAFIPLDEGN